MYCSANVAEARQISSRERPSVCAGARIFTLQFRRQDAIVLLSERALLLVDSTPDNVLHLVHGEQYLARLRVQPLLLPQCGAEVRRR